LGLGAEARLALAERRRAAFAATLGPEPDDLRAEFRRRQRWLAPWLTETTPAAIGDLGPEASCDRLCQTTIAAAAPLAPRDRAGLTAALPALLHLQAVRLCGLDPAEEQAAHVLWARTLAGLAARARRS
jgi:hypothetical protein